MYQPQPRALTRSWRNDAFVARLKTIDEHEDSKYIDQPDISIRQNKNLISNTQIPFGLNFVLFAYYLRWQKGKHFLSNKSQNQNSCQIWLPFK